jgi:hypothetical protein
LWVAANVGSAIRMRRKVGKSWLHRTTDEGGGILAGSKPSGSFLKPALGIDEETTLFLLRAVVSPTAFCIRDWQALRCRIGKTLPAVDRNRRSAIRG